jgi:hypothetical protein
MAEGARATGFRFEELRGLQARPADLAQFTAPA